MRSHRGVHFFEMKADKPLPCGVFGHPASPGIGPSHADAGETAVPSKTASPMVTARSSTPAPNEHPSTGL